MLDGICRRRAALPCGRGSAAFIQWEVPGVGPYGTECKRSRLRQSHLQFVAVAISSKEGRYVFTEFELGAVSKAAQLSGLARADMAWLGTRELGGQRTEPTTKSRNARTFAGGTCRERWNA